MKWSNKNLNKTQNTWIENKYYVIHKTINMKEILLSSKGFFFIIRILSSKGILDNS